MFEVGSALCGAAPSKDALIVGRAIAGLGCWAVLGSCDANLALHNAY